MNKIEIDLKTLLKAVAIPKMKRAPAGSNGKIGKVTRLDGNFTNKLAITAPAHSTIIDCKGTLRDSLEFDSATIFQLISKLSKMKTEIATITIEGRQMFFQIDNFKVSCNALDIK